jgi:hypothetical protein
MSGRAARLSLGALVASAGIVALAATVAGATPGPSLNAGGQSGLAYAHGMQGTVHRAGSPQLVFHGGRVMTGGAAVTSIFWGPSWSSAGFGGDKVAGLDSFYAGVGTTAYAGTTTEYTDSVGHVGTTVTSSGHLTDVGSTPSRAPSTSAVLAVVARNIAYPTANGYYPVYSDIPRGHAGYCAWHSWGTIGGTLVQFAFFFSLDGDAGCDPQDASGLHSQGLAALANVSGHELSEALTDPHGDAWYDSAGSENSDKCAWTYGRPLLTFTNGTRWKIQGNWSNSAYLASSGYPSGGPGCVDGG